MAEHYYGMWCEEEECWHRAGNGTILFYPDRGIAAAHANVLEVNSHAHWRAARFGDDGRPKPEPERLTFPPMDMA